MTVVLVALGAAVGAPLRFWLGQRLDDDPSDGGWPWGTLAVNLVGSFLLGFFTALGLGAHAIALLGTGFCGGLTTYSSFAVQTVRLGTHRPAGGLGYALVTVLAALGLAAVGFWLG